jgi:hypothetical protein
MTNRKLASFKPSQGRNAQYSATGIAQDGFQPTSRFQLIHVRNHGRTEAQRLSVDSVTFEVEWLHQFNTTVTVDKHGFLTDHGASDLSSEQLFREISLLT